MGYATKVRNQDRQQPSSSRSRHLVWIIVAIGVLLRARGIDTRPLWVDEAESSINALTILEHGAPVDHYLGQPIFENTLYLPWPESEEYEYRDASYSSKGLAIYHGWLPLYSIAAVQRLCGVTPDRLDAPPGTRTGEEIRWRTAVPRLPSLLFSALLLLCVFYLARTLGGSTAAWPALLLTALSESTVLLGRDARYYAATLLFSALCALLIARVHTRGRWRDFGLYALALVGLFHTHLISCFVFSLLSILLCADCRRIPAFWWKSAAAAGVFASCTIPWLFATGFLEHATGIPQAWQVMEGPADLFRYAGQPAEKLLPILGCVVFVLLCRRFATRPWARGFQHHAGAYVFLLAWGSLAFAVFGLFIPVVSLLPRRMSLLLILPKILIASLFFADFARALGARRSAWIASGLALSFLVATDRAQPIRERVPDCHAIEQIAHRVAAEPTTTRVYSMPNWHLTLTYYSGRPVQSVAPVRKGFLDNYRGAALLVQPVRFPPILTTGHLRMAARGVGRSLTEAEALRIVEWLRIERVSESLIAGDPATAPRLPRPDTAAGLDLEPALDWDRSLGWWSGVLTFRGADIQSLTQAWRQYFYRFAREEQRLGKEVNFADRFADARVEVYPWAWQVVYAVPALDATRD